MQSSKEAFLEDECETLQEINELTQRWHDGFSDDNRRLVERYLKREMGIGVELRFKEANSTNLIAIFERKGRLILRHIDGSTCLWRGDQKFNVAYGTSSGKDSSMFVGDVELIQLPERVALASTVRLHKSDDVFDLWTNPTKEFGSTLIVGQSRLIPTYWEIGFSQYRLIHVGAEFKDEFGGEAVQRASQVVDDIANIAAPLGWHIFADANAIDFNRWLRCFVGPDSVSFAVSERFDSICQIVKVFCGPVDLYPATEQWITVHGKA